MERMPSWSVATYPTDHPKSWLSVIKRDGRLVETIEQTGSRLVAEQDAQRRQRDLAKQDDQR
jgi:hypothetical protein